MADDVITVLSSEDEDVSSPPRKRIKPTLIEPLAKNFQEVTITKVPKADPKSTVVVLGSDEDDDDDDDIVYVDRSIMDISNITNSPEIKNGKNNGSNSKSDVISIEESDISKTKQTHSDSEVISINKDAVTLVNGISKSRDKSNLTDSSADSTVQIIDDNSDDEIVIEKSTTIDEERETNLSSETPVINDDSVDESVSKDVESISKDDDSMNKDVEKEIIEEAIKNAIQPCSSAGKPSNTKLLADFLEVVDSQIQADEYSIVKAKFPLMWRYYNECVSDLGEAEGFKKILLSNTKRAKKSVALSVISFKDVFEHLKDKIFAESIEVDRSELIKLKKLEKTIKKLVRIIGQLENDEIDFEEEENSTYLKLDRYTARLDKVYKMYCQLMNKNPFQGRLTHSKLGFVDSQYNEINHAINKKYKNNKIFPSYYEIQKLIEKVVKENDLTLSESKIKEESERCFKRLGELLQSRRRKDLYDSHQLFIKDSEDPAKVDPTLNSILKVNYEEGQSKIEKIVQEYVNKQNSKGDVPEENENSSDSEKGSNEDDENDSEDEDDDSSGNKEK